MQRRPREGNILIEPKTCEKGDRKDYTERKDMRRHAHFKAANREILQVMPHSVIVNQEIQHPVQHHVPATTNSIAK